MLSAFLGSAASAAGSASPVVDRTMEETILREMNTARISKGLAKLKASRILRKPARSHGSYMFQVGRLVHEGPGGAEFWKRLVRAGYPKNRPLAENIATMQGCPWTAKQVVRMWLDSPPHRANLLSNRMRVVGVGVVTTGSCGTTYFVTDFGG